MSKRKSPVLAGKTDSATEIWRHEALLETRALQNAILGSTNFPCIATDADGVIQIFNIGAERMLGYSAADVVNKLTPANLHDPREISARAAALSLEFDTPIAPGVEALVFNAARGVDDSYELTYIRNDGGSFAAIVSVAALRDPQGGIVGYLLVGTDNTAQKHVEEERMILAQRLRSQQLYTCSFIESSIDALVASDALGIITDVNESTVDATGIPRAQLIGTDLFDCFTDPNAARASHERVFADGFVRDYPLAIRHTTGRIMDVLYNAAVYKDDAGKILGVFAAARDHTERKLLDKVLREKTAELEAARAMAKTSNIEMSEFLSSMSHEMRTPLNSILGFAQLINSGTPPLTTAQKHSADQILKAGWNLLDLINEVLGLAVMESGDLSLSPEPVLVSDAMRERQATSEPQA